MPEPLKWLIGGGIGGAIGAAIWAGISYATESEIGLLAWGVGVLVGIGVRIGSPNSWGVGPGAAAAVIALVALLGGRYAAISAIVSNQFGDMQIDLSDIEPPTGEERVELAISNVADMVIDQWANEGRDIPEVDYDNYPDDATIKDDYAPEVWKEAESRWADLGDAGQQGMLDEVDANFAELGDMTADFSGAMTNAVFKESFSPIDLLFAALAVFSAFKIGGAMEDGE